MFTIKNLFSRALLALALMSSAGATLAAPVAYRVAIDTSSLSGEGLLDFSFIGGGTYQSANAVLSNFSGSFGDVYDAFGAVTGDTTSSITFGNLPGDNYLTQVVNFGGLFRFDALFDAAPADVGTLFGVNLYLPEFADFALGEGALVGIELNANGSITPEVRRPYATLTPMDIAEVPEPGQWLLMAIGLFAMCSTMRRVRRVRR